MVRKKAGSTTMESRFDALEQRMQETEARNQQRFAEQSARFVEQNTRMDQILALLQTQTKTVEARQRERPNVNGSTGDGERRLRKIDLPVFNGEDAPGWLTKIERFFKVRKIEDDEKIDAAMMAVEGEALSWLQWWEANNDAQTWDDLKEAMLRRFQPTVITNAFEMLMSMKQEGTVREYRKKFENVSSHIKVQDQELFAGLFSNGLREDIRAEVRLQRPKDLAEMMEVALLVEEKIGAVDKFGGQNRFKNWRGENQSKNWRNESQNKTSTDASNTSKSNDAGKVNQAGGTKSIGGKELEERRKKGLCFTCEEKFVPGHICKNKVLKLLYVEETGEQVVETDIEEKEEREEIVWEGNLKSLHLYSMAGLSSKSSFMIKGRLGNIEVIVLVDCGATHSFVSMKLVAANKLTVEETPPCWVKLVMAREYQSKGYAEEWS